MGGRGTIIVWIFTSFIFGLIRCFDLFFQSHRKVVFWVVFEARQCCSGRKRNDQKSVWGVTSLHNSHQPLNSITQKPSCTILHFLPRPQPPHTHPECILSSPKTHLYIILKSFLKLLKAVPYSRWWGEKGTFLHRIRWQIWWFHEFGDKFGDSMNSVRNSSRIFHPIEKSRLNWEKGQHFFVIISSLNLVTFFWRRFHSWI